MKIFDFVHQLVFYASYHSNTVNKIIHIVFVPTILWTVCVWLSNFHLFDVPISHGNFVVTNIPVVDQYLQLGLASAQKFFGTSHGLFNFSVFATQPAIEFTVATAVAIIYLVYYIVLEPVAGILYIPVLLGFSHLGNLFLHNVPNANMLALYIHLVAWVAQFIGHGIFEKRAPALFDSLIQAFLLAPLFVWMELLFAIGYRPALQREINQKAAAAKAQWKRDSQKKRS
jgi:uncharacterized membrane protein YGL010W